MSRSPRPRGGVRTGTVPGGTVTAEGAQQRPVRMRHRCTVPDFTPVRTGPGRYRMARAVRGRRRIAAAALAVVATGLTVTGSRPGSGDAPHATPTASPTNAAQRDRGTAPARTPVSVPVRIADADAARLLRHNDRVDVIAATAGSNRARVVARCGRVAHVAKSGDTVTSDGALVVLTVPRDTATALAGSSATSRLAVTLC